MPEGLCVSCSSQCECLTEPEIFASTFEGSSLYSLAFSHTKGIYQQDIHWRLDSTRWLSPPTSAYLGHPDCPTYYNGALDANCQPIGGAGSASLPVSATLRSPIISLAPDVMGYVAFVWVWADVEPLIGISAEPDILEIFVEEMALTPTLAWKVTNTLTVGKNTDTQWKLIAFDLAPWRGTDIRLGFAFDTLDGLNNHHEGIYLDDLSVMERCEGGCCDADSDCLALFAPLPCTEARCIPLNDGAGKVCARNPRMLPSPCEPCSNNLDCLDDNPCTEDTCEPELFCTHTTFCCVEQTLFAADFEGTLDEWTMLSDAPDSPVVWQISDTLMHDGAQSAWFGDPTTQSFSWENNPTSGSLRSPPIVLPPTDTLHALTLSFWLYLDTEWSLQPTYLNPVGLDRLTVSLLTEGQEIEIWSSDVISGSTWNLWQHVTLSLDPWAGQQVQVQFRFDSLDGYDNDHKGPYIDALWVGSTCL